MNVYLGGKRVAIDPSRSIGSGGEADVFRIGGGRALKVFKTPSHPDLSGLPEDQAAAERRLQEHQRKLKEFPTNLPDRVITPLELATDRASGGRIVGYAMREVTNAELLHRFAEPKYRRRGVSITRIADVLRDLHSTVGGVHGAGVVLGDFNDLNVLVEGPRAHLIDADSYQFAGYRCSVFSARFVDPSLCDSNGRSPVLCKPHTVESDWYAFAVMVMRSLLCVGPYGGVFRPKDHSRRVSHGARPLHRITVFDSEVVYPKPAIHYGVLPDDLLHYLQRVFSDDLREPFPRSLVESLRWTRCASCDQEHARLVCPSCIAPAQRARATIRVRGKVTAETIFSGDGVIVAASAAEGHARWLYWDGTNLRREDGVAVATVGPTPDRHFARVGAGAVVSEGGRAVCFDDAGTSRVLSVDACDGVPAVDSTALGCVWVEGGRLMRDGLLGPVHMGDVLQSQTRIWVGDELGFGFYRAGGLEVGLLFDPTKRGITEVMQPLGLRGKLVDIHCVPAPGQVWFFVVEDVAGTLVARALVLAADGRVLAAASSPDQDSWLFHADGSCPVGRMLLVPTDGGIVRVEPRAGSLEVTKSFPDTEPFVDAASRLLATERGLLVVGRRRVVKVTLA